MSMRYDNDYREKRRRNKLIGRFFLTVAIIVFVFSAVFVLAATAYKSSADKKAALNGDEEKSDVNTVVADQKINIAVMGLDEDEIHSDVIFVVSFDTSSGEMDLVSVPRDTQVFMSDSMMLDMKNNGRDDYIPTKYGTVGECKITEVYAYAGPEKNNEYLVQVLEDLLDIDIDHYVAINITAFKEIVDAIGGVDMYVPMDMYWDMRDNGGPLINLKEGEQHLDGAEAEQLVRFRKGYAQQDIGRIETQHEFMKAVINKLFDSENVLSDMTAVVQAVYKYVKTDMTLVDCISYLKYISLIDTSKITMETIPGTAENMYIPDYDGIKEMSDRVFKGIVEEDTATETSSAGASKDYKIEVANGGFKNGYAAATQERLNALGYNVTEISSYDGTKMPQTRIYVSEDGIGDDLVDLFKSAEVIVDASQISSGTDIKIITGSEEQ